MGIIVVILEAIAALSGPMADMLKSLFQAAHDFHAKGDTTPDELATEAIDTARKAVTLYTDVNQQIQHVASALQASHSNLPPTVAYKNAAAAVEHVS